MKKEKKIKWESPVLQSLSKKKQAYGACTGDGGMDAAGCTTNGEGASTSCTSVGNVFF